MMRVRGGRNVTGVQGSVTEAQKCPMGQLSVTGGMKVLQVGTRAMVRSATGGHGVIAGVEGVRGHGIATGGGGARKCTREAGGRRPGT